MKFFFVLGFMVSYTKAVFKVVDIFFNIYTDFICFFPFFWTLFHSKIGSKILFGININHSSEGRCCAGIITMTYTAFCFIHFIVLTFRIMMTAGNAIFNDDVTIIFQREFYTEWDKYFFKYNFTEKGFVDFNSVKSGIHKKSLRLY